MHSPSTAPCRPDFADRTQFFRYLYRTPTPRTKTSFASISNQSRSRYFHQPNMTHKRPRDTLACPCKLAPLSPQDRPFFDACTRMPLFVTNSSHIALHLPHRPGTSPRTAPGTGVRMGLSRRAFCSAVTRVTCSALLAISVPNAPADAARPEGVNRPDLLPPEFTTIIDLERFLASGEKRRLAARIDDVEQRTGFKIRLLTQRYPQSPGAAIKNFWGVDSKSIVIVADYFGGSGQLLKFNVGASVDRVLPPRFWSVLSANYGNKFYVSKNGEATSIINAVEAICSCLLKGGCSTPPTSSVASRKNTFGKRAQ